jgi:threonine dehydratase
MMQTTIPLSEFFTAQKELKTYLKPTPLVYSSAISEWIGAEVWLKLESQQPTGSFKVRGATVKLSRLREKQGVHGIVTGSAGNHGLGVGYAGKVLGFSPVTIVIPKTAPESKRDKLLRFPIELVETGETYEDAHQAALDLAKKEGWSYIPAYDDIDIITGQGTIGLEILDELPQTDVVVVPVGGGGLIAGIANAAKQINPALKVIGVQAAASPAAKLSLENGQPYDPYEHEPTMADGLSGGFGKIPFYLARMLIDRVELATEQQFAKAVYQLLSEEQVLAEPSGAISVHPIVKGDEDWQGSSVVCVISGGNLSVSLLQKIIADHLR